MSELTQEQIERIEDDLNAGSFDTADQEWAVRLLLEAYEERGREVARLEADVRRLTQMGAQAEAEVERLRAERIEERAVLQENWRCEEQKALQAEARLARVVEALEDMLNGDSALRPAEWAALRQRAVKVLGSRDAAGQPEEKP